MLRQLRAAAAKSTDRVIELWQACGIITPVKCPNAPLKVEWKVLKKMWGQFCIVVCTESKTTCSCPLRCDEGHCPHMYACEDIVNKRRWRGTPMPDAAKKSSSQQQKSKDAPDGSSAGQLFHRESSAETCSLYNGKNAYDAMLASSLL
eukprot:359428-Karenia_brevis.AAC.1